MNNRLFFVLFFCSFITTAQTSITGTVYEKNGPLEGAAVYVNNTMVGTTTNRDGKFSIKINEGQYDLIVSYLGYQKIIYSLNTKNYTKPLVFALVEEKNILDEIIIKKTIYDDEWKYNLSSFKKGFIGETNLAKDCTILNPKVLHFNFDAKNNILTAFAKKPLEIVHKNLGYKIIFELEEFSINKNQITYLGYSRYKNLKGSKRKQCKWAKNRLTAYLGSFTHFYQSLQKNTTYKDGFIIHQIKRVLNPERPTEKAIKKARELVKLHQSNVNFSKEINSPKTALDTAIIVLRKVQLPKYKDHLYKSKVAVKDIIIKKTDTFYLNFQNLLLVVYTKELEEEAYILRDFMSKKRKPHPQSSILIPFKQPITIDKNGLLINPLDIYYEGYWSYEKFANSLPIDYTPTAN